MHFGQPRRVLTRRAKKSETKEAQRKVKAAKAKTKEEKAKDTKDTKGVREATKGTKGGKAKVITPKEEEKDITQKVEEKGARVGAVAQEEKDPQFSREIVINVDYQDTRKLDVQIWD